MGESKTADQFTDDDDSGDYFPSIEPSAEQLNERITFELRDVKLRLDQVNHSLWAICIMLGLLLALLYFRD